MLHRTAMISMNRSPVIAMLCWLVVVQAWSTDVSDPVLDFVSVYNGVYDNTDQMKSSNQKPDAVQMRMIPVKIPALWAHAFYFDEKVNGIFYRQHMEVITKVRNGVIYLALINFTKSSLPDPKNLNPDDLDNLKSEDFQAPDSSCTGAVKQVAPGIFTGNWPDCRVTIDKKHPIYAATTMCDSTIVTMPLFARETTLTVPYILKRKGDRFPARNLPDNYVGPCDRKQLE